MDFLQNVYPYNFEGIRNTVYEYRFISEGEKKGDIIDKALSSSDSNLESMIKSALNTSDKK